MQEKLENKDVIWEFKNGWIHVWRVVDLNIKKYFLLGWKIEERKKSEIVIWEFGIGESMMP